MNILHRPHQIVGAYVANELIYPTEGADDIQTKPYIEVLSVFWKDYFPEEYAWVESAYKSGKLAVSMESTPESLTCQTCNEEFAYMGSQHQSYCTCMRSSPVAPRILNKPHFQAGGLILPPANPGWKGADVTDISAQVEIKRLREAAQEQDLDWQELMGGLLDQAKDGVDKEPHDFSGDNEECQECGKKKMKHWAMPKKMKTGSGDKEKVGY